MTGHVGVDSLLFFLGPNEFGDTIEIVADWEGIDFMIALIAMDQFPLHFMERNVLDLDCLIEVIINSAQASHKPMAIVIHSSPIPDINKRVAAMRQEFVSAGLPSIKQLPGQRMLLTGTLNIHTIVAANLACQMVGCRRN